MSDAVHVVVIPLEQARLIYNLAALTEDVTVAEFDALVSLASAIASADQVDQ